MHYTIIEIIYMYPIKQRLKKIKLDTNLRKLNTKISIFEQWQTISHETLYTILTTYTKHKRIGTTTRQTQRC